ncbi:MAG TPA: alpha/beta fold hydrolase [Solirubrobacteraceae bacterium]|jgi:pimeloyl-ACP methyl ester carboxylesterase
MDTAFSPWHRGGSGPPLVLLHGFTDTWRCWELVLPALERRHEVLALTLAGHAGGPPIEGEVTDASLADAVERTMDELGWETAHFAGNSLGGYVALQLAARGRARSVVALAPAGGWAEGDTAFADALGHFRTMQELLETAAPLAEQIASTPAGRQRAMSHVAERTEHLPADLVAHEMRGAAACGAVFPFIEHAERHGWNLDGGRITCPVRVVWGREDKLCVLPGAAARYRRDWVPQADWVELDGVGHCPQLDVPLEAAQLILGWTAP